MNVVYDFCVRLWRGTSWFCPYPPGLFHKPQSNHVIAPVPMKQPWGIWVNKLLEYCKNLSYNHNKTKQPCAYLVSFYIAYLHCMAYNIYIYIYMIIKTFKSTLIIYKSATSMADWYLADINSRVLATLDAHPQEHLSLLTGNLHCNPPQHCDGSYIKQTISHWG